MNLITWLRLRPLGPAILTAAVFLSSACSGLTRANIETPAYEVVESDDNFEHRIYPSLQVVRTAMPDNNDNRSFGLLFRYIQGDNQQRQKIEMTSPVLMENSADGPTMAFIVPVETAEKGTPAPNNVAVTNDTINAGHFAAMTFPGRRSQATEKQALETIMTWISEKKFEPSGEILFAYYDPPWTPIPLRRNEVLIRIAPPKPN